MQRCSMSPMYASWLYEASDIYLFTCLLEDVYVARIGWIPSAK
jgi:hypothetical protein